MKPLLVIGLGNSLMGGDGIGCAVTDRLASDQRLPDYAEVLSAGSDLLRCAGWMEDRRLVVVIDAILDDHAEPGFVRAFEDGCGLEERQDHAHHLSAVQAIRLLQMLTPVPCTLLGISVVSVEAGVGIPAGLNARIPAILDRVLQELRRWAPDSKEVS